MSVLMEKARGGAPEENESTRSRLYGRVGLVGIVLILGGCAHTASFNQSYLAAARHPAAETASGKVLVKTSEQDDAYVYSGHPTSFTGHGTTLTIPLGKIAKEASQAAFSDVFTGGADLSNELKSASDYRVIVTPKIVEFTYEYNQLKNIGFAITPTVTVKLKVQLLDVNGNSKWERDYDSGAVEGPSYMLDTSPQERISKLAHKALYEQLTRAASDIRTEGSDAGTSTVRPEKP